MKKNSNPAPPSIESKPPAPPAPPRASHVHCEECCSPHCYGIEVREALPATHPSPEWMQRARLEGRAEFVEILLDQGAELFCDEYTTSQPLGATSDYSVNWDRHKLADLFEVNEVAASLIDRANGAYWSQEATIDNLTADRDRLDWLDKNRGMVMALGLASAKSSLRDLIDAAIRKDRASILRT